MNTNKQKLTLAKSEQFALRIFFLLLSVFLMMHTRIALLIHQGRLGKQNKTKHKQAKLTIIVYLYQNQGDYQQLLSDLENTEHCSSKINK